MKHHTVKELPIASLIKAAWNYKADDKALSEKLTNNIRKNGQVETIIVRPLNDSLYEVVNGNHRLEALLELKYESVLCIDVGPISEIQAKRLALETNETRFLSDPNKIGVILSELTNVYSADDLISTMGLSEDDICTYSEMSKFDWDKYTNDGITTEIQPGIKKLILTLSNSQHLKWEDWLRHCGSVRESVTAEDGLELLLDKYANINQI